MHALYSWSSISATKPALSRDARHRGATTLVGDLCAHRRNDTTTRKSIEHSSPRANQQKERERERDGKREKGRKRRGTRSCRMVGILPSQMAMTTTYFPRPGISRYVSRLPFASMVLSTLQKSLSTCCLSVSSAFYIRKCWIFSIATSLLI